MMNARTLLRPSFFLALVVICLGGTTSLAGSLQVSTVTLDVAAPGAATTIGLRNTGSEPINAQLRTFKWTQTGGLEQLTSTEEIAVSPPFATIEPGREYTVRVVRIARAPLQQEVSYRLVIDELPNPGTSPGIGVKFAVRYSIPVFFGPVTQTPGTLAWRADTSPGRVRLTAINSGGKRVRLSALKLTGTDGTNILRESGLVGYVLGSSAMSWTFPIPKGRTLSGPALLVAESDRGPINARIPLTPLP